MKKLFFSAMLLSAGLSACNTNNNNNTVSKTTLVTGKWECSFVVVDNNGNDIIDDSEKYPPATYGYAAYAIYNADMSAVDSFYSITNSNGVSTHGTWALNSAETFLIFTSPGNVGSSRLVQLDANNLIVEDTVGSPHRFFEYVHY